MKVARICHYAVATHLGGAERSLLELVRGQIERPARGYEPWVLLPKAEGPLVSELARAGIPHEVLPLPLAFLSLSRSMPWTSIARSARVVPGLALYLARLARLLREQKVALIHSAGIKGHPVAATAGRGISIPVLWHLRDMVGRGPTLWSLRGCAWATGVRAVANSRATADAFRPGTSVVYNGLNAEEFFPRPHRRFHSMLGVPESVPMIGVIAVLARWKGQIEFLKMAAELRRQGVNAAFTVIGGEIYDTENADRGYAESLKTEARKLGIADRVLFTGFLRDAAEAVNGLDVLVHASLKPEPFGRVAIEGMACGVPVVAAASGGILEIIQDGKNGLLYRPGDVPAMAAAVRRLLEDPALREGLVREGQGVFRTRFTTEQYVEAVARIYDELIAS